jgi:hypothetical protein
MAYADYYHCDVCDAKAFYDANLNYDMGDLDSEGNPKLDYVGSMKVLCDKCSETHEIVINERY